MIYEFEYTYLFYYHGILSMVAIAIVYSLDVFYSAANCELEISSRQINLFTRKVEIPFGQQQCVFIDPSYRYK